VSRATSSLYYVGLLTCSLASNNNLYSPKLAVDIENTERKTEIGPTQIHIKYQEKTQMKDM